MTKPGTNALQLSDPDRRRALIGCVIFLSDAGCAEGALCRYVPGSGIEALKAWPTEYIVDSEPSPANSEGGGRLA